MFWRDRVWGEGVEREQARERARESERENTDRHAEGRCVSVRASVQDEETRRVLWRSLRTFWLGGMQGERYCRKRTRAVQI